jgi:hypothetical protein
MFIIINFRKIQKKIELNLVLMIIILKQQIKDLVETILVAIILDDIFKFKLLKIISINIIHNN